MRKRVAALGIAVMLLLTSSVTLTQGAQGTANPSADQWALVKSVPVGEKLTVKLWSGRTIDGRVLSVSDTTLQVSRKNQITDINQAEIQKIYRVFADSEVPKAFGAVGSLVGLVAGILSAVTIGMREGTNNNGARVGLAVLIPAASIGGGLAGRAIGKRVARELIYEAKQQLNQTQPGSKQP